MCFFFSPDAKLPRWGYLKPFIALSSLDGVFRGCFARVLTFLLILLLFIRLLVRKTWCLLILAFPFCFRFWSPNKRPKTCHFYPENVIPRTRCLDWVNWNGERPSVAAPSPSPEMVSKLPVRASARDLLFRDPDNFTAGEIHFHLPRWDVILQGHNKRDEILSYLKVGVDVLDFFLSFKGDYQGTYYDSAFPSSIKFSNSKSYAGLEDFINKTILERLANGSLSIWGKVCFASPPHHVMPLFVEPTKPRLCHDERFLNLWIRDLPLTLDYICNLPRYVAHNHFQSTMDDKSGYDHVRLSPKSRTFFGLEWCGWYFMYNTIPFG